MPQALRVQVLNTVCSKGLPERTKLQSIAAAVELWPEALLPAMSSQASAPTTLETCLDSLLQHLGILGVCLHANLEHLCKQHGALECSTVNDEQLGQQSAADVPATTADRSGKAGRQLLLKWGQCPVTQTAGQVLHSLLGTSWQQGASQAGQQLDSAAQQFNGSAVSLSDMAAEQVLAELKELGTAENGEAGPVDDRWVDLGLALQLMISVLGWEWAYEQVHCTTVLCLPCQQFCTCKRCTVRFCAFRYVSFWDCTER